MRAGGDRAASETELSLLYHVTRGTVRHALEVWSAKA